MKTLWIVGAGPESVPGITRAKDMGFFVVTSDGNLNSPGFSLADDHVVVSTYDIEGTVDVARQYSKNTRPIDGVISIAVDVPLTVATVAQALDLPSISIETARLAIDKLAMKERFVDKGVPCPWFQQVESVEHLQELIHEQKDPLVLKPVDSRGARGVLRLCSVKDLSWAFAHSLAFSPSQRLMVEEYLTGPQLSTESVILDGEGFTPGFSDRNYEFLERFSPYVIENGGELPSALPKKDRDAVVEVVEQAAEAIGIVTGIAKGDMVMTTEGPKVIEVAPRLSGGWFSTDQIPIATGIDLVGIAIKISLGQPISREELNPRYDRGVAVRYFFPSPGRVVDIHHTDKGRLVPGVHRLGFFVNSNEFIEPVSNHTKRVGFVITTGDTRAQAVERAKTVIETVQIETVPV